MALALTMIGCASTETQKTVETPRPTTNWRLAERDGLVVFEPQWSEASYFEARYIGPDSPAVGTVVAVEIRVPNAAPHERRRFLVHPLRSGVRLLDEPVAETVGDAPVRVRFTADASGRGGVGITEHGSRNTEER